jgi:hypothetical protein
MLSAIEELSLQGNGPDIVAVNDAYALAWATPLGVSLTLKSSLPGRNATHHPNTRTMLSVVVPLGPDAGHPRRLR